MTADTAVCALSCDSRYSHAAWGASIGGVSFPMLSDFCPFGEVSRAYGAFLADKCMTDRATVIIDKRGMVQYAESIGPDGGPRNMCDLLNRAQAINGPPLGARGAAVVQGAKSARQATPRGFEYRLFLSGSCGYCHQVRQAVANLHCKDLIDVREILNDPPAKLELLSRMHGKARVPTLVRLSDGKTWLGPKEIIPVLIANSLSC